MNEHTSENPNEEVKPTHHDESAHHEGRHSESQHNEIPHHEGQHNQSHHEKPVHHVPTYTDQFDQPKNKGGVNMWMLVTLVLAGVIVGYGVSNFAGFNTVKAPAAAVVQKADDKTNGSASADVAAVLTDEQTKALPETDPVIGDANAPVTIVEFSDFQCPFCEVFYTQTLTQLTKDFIDTGKVKLVYRDYPLSIHPFAVAAAHAAECANDQKKFKEMHDMLFSKQKEWSQVEKVLDVFTGYAKTIGLDEKVYGECMSTQKNLPEIRKDMLDGLAVGVKGTPHFFIDGHRISGALDYESVFKKAIQAELDKKQWKLSADPLTNEPFVEIQ